MWSDLFGCLPFVVRRIVFVTAVLFNAAHGSAEVLSGDKEPARMLASSEKFACGSRAAVLFCRLNGVHVSLADAKRVLAPRPEGTSMLEICGFLSDNGIDCGMRQLNPTELQAAPLPIIAFLLPEHMGGEIGHFEVITKVENSGPTLVDPITGISAQWGWRAFSDAWSGHCITGYPLGTSRKIWVVLGLYALALFGVVKCWNAGIVQTAGSCRYNSLDARSDSPSGQYGPALFPDSAIETSSGGRA